MTKAALDVLRLMEHGEEFMYERGVGYIGHIRVKRASSVLMELIHAMAIRRVSMAGCTEEYYRIGPEGLAALKL
jgi:hypothetical protein